MHVAMDQSKWRGEVKRAEEQMEGIEDSEEVASASEGSSDFVGETAPRRARGRERSHRREATGNPWEL